MEKGAKKKKSQQQESKHFSYFLTELLNNTLNPKLCAPYITDLTLLLESHPSQFVAFY